MTPAEVLDVLTDHQPADGIGGLIVCGCGRLTLTEHGQLEHQARQVADLVHTGGRPVEEPARWLRARELLQPGCLDDGARLCVPITGSPDTPADGQLIDAKLLRFGLIEMRLLQATGTNSAVRTVIAAGDTWIGVFP